MILTGILTKVHVDRVNNRIGCAQVRVNRTDRQFYQVQFALNPGETILTLRGAPCTFIPRPDGTAFLVSR
jgi:hypothetical protein